jgi:hypothetical protein
MERRRSGGQSQRYVVGLVLLTPANEVQTAVSPNWLVDRDYGFRVCGPALDGHFFRGETLKIVLDFGELVTFVPLSERALVHAGSVRPRKAIAIRRAVRRQEAPRRGQQYPKSVLLYGRSLFHAFIVTGHACLSILIFALDSPNLPWYHVCERIK